ncbi:MAG: hypothetical protein AB8I08_12005 [Sandaracinaceae bacterium]
MSTPGWGLAALLVSVACLSACAAGPRRFPLARVMWDDPDRRTFSPRPESFYSPYMWDGADNGFFRPASEFFLFEPGRAAMNVNAIDEVPNSSWYTNRLARRAMSPNEIARGACNADFAMPFPWTIVGGKPDGANPGFQIRDANGQRYLLKTEGTRQPWRPGAADAVGAAIFHAAGYWAPCNRVVEFRREQLERDPEATIEYSNGHEEALSESHVEAVLRAALELPDGRFRASVSRFVEGRPIGPWRYDGTRDDDPNDVVDHQHRRELRGMRLLSAWTDHIDSRQENTMAAWMTEDEDAVGYVRHYLIDFGDCFGITHAWDPLVRRFGHSGYLDFEHVLVDFLTLGLTPRPWREARQGAAEDTLGYFDVFRFDPEAWRPGYANPAFDRRTEADEAWMARIIARFGDAHLRALAAQGHFQDPVIESELARILIGRRDRILERYLTRLSPLTWPEVRTRSDGAPEVCAQDLAVLTETRPASSRRYSVRAWTGRDELREADRPQLRRAEAAYVCAALPSVPEASEDEPVYAVLDLIAQTPGEETTEPARLHLWATGPDRFTLVGLERPTQPEPPR